MFTGLYPSRHRAHYWRGSPVGRPLAEHFDTLPEILAQKGYSTIAVVANYGYLGPSFRLDQRFQYYEAWSPLPFVAEEFFLRNALRRLLASFVPARELEAWLRSASDINRSVFHLLDEAKSQGGPFFLFVNYIDAHWPYMPPPPFDDLFPGKDSSFTWQRFVELEEQVSKLERRITEEEHRDLLSQYDGEIRYLDFHLGNLIARLRMLGLYDDCLLIVTSDHGEAFGERNLMSHGVSVY